MWYPCNLADKERGLECACVNNDSFTVLVSGGARRRWVSMCTVWLSHSKYLSRAMNMHQILHWAWTFLQGNYSSHSEGFSYGQLVIDSFITTTHPLMPLLLGRVSWWNIQITQVTQPPFSPDLMPCNIWLFPKLKSPLKWKRF